jgi:hypothetical protein
MFLLIRIIFYLRAINKNYNTSKMTDYYFIYTEVVDVC